MSWRCVRVAYVYQTIEIALSLPPHCIVLRRHLVCDPYIFQMYIYIYIRPRGMFTTRPCATAFSSWLAHALRSLCHVYASYTFALGESQGHPQRAGYSAQGCGDQ